MPDALKDMYSPAFFDALEAALTAAYPPFDGAALRARSFDAAWEGRSLLERMRHVTAVLHDLLPDDYRAALDILQRAAPDLRAYAFPIICFPEFAARYGLHDWEASLPALEFFTQIITAEFAVRPFILADPPRMMAQMRAWADHPHEQVRRLASEGCRPRLPWGVALPVFKRDPAPILPILERLKNDPAETVRRSVANNLNDIAKDNPEVVIEVLRRWLPQATPEVQWVSKHALRSLVKAGHPAALGLLGFTDAAAVAVAGPILAGERVAVGRKLAFHAEIESLADRPQNLVIDYVVYYQKANGTLAPKVFKLTQRLLQPGERLRVAKSVSFAPITTRVFYPGEHALRLKINGAEYGDARFVVDPA